MNLQRSSVTCPISTEPLISFKAKMNLWEEPSSPDPSNLTKTLLTSLELSLFGVAL
ncbi:hypothetical protein PanWU01x14_139350 [Parasponia andersonii]|uniref:Uncharacterized protein n=1 Tax=Parasponia andersonii TaxID=3476 RepID=A0A2P5CMY5_PARAD|nr:hypothetical protein PanWU01x14_139350 [Parasponia andersonii]